MIIIEIIIIIIIVVVVIINNIIIFRVTADILLPWLSDKDQGCLNVEWRWLRSQIGDTMVKEKI